MKVTDSTWNNSSKGLNQNESVTINVLYCFLFFKLSSRIDYIYFQLTCF